MKFAAALALLPLALAAPVSPKDVKRADTSAVVSTTPFKLVSRTIGGNAAYDALPVYTYHIDPATNWAVLGSSDNNTPPTAVVNGTVDQLASLRGDVEFGLGEDGSIPYGWTVSSQYGEGVAVQINGGAGTPGLYLHDEGEEAQEEIYILKYDTPFWSGWYGCNSTLEYGPALQVFARFNEATPAECTDIELVALFQ